VLASPAWRWVWLRGTVLVLLAVGVLSFRRASQWPMGEGSVVELQRVGIRLPYCEGGWASEDGQWVVPIGVDRAGGVSVHGDRFERDQLVGLAKEAAARGRASYSRVSLGADVNARVRDLRAPIEAFASNRFTRFAFIVRRPLDEAWQWRDLSFAVANTMPLGKAEEALSVVITRDRLSLYGRDLDEDKLRTIAGKLAAMSRDVVVTVAPDEDVEQRHLVRVMGLLQRQGLLNLWLKLPPAE